MVIDFDGDDDLDIFVNNLRGSSLYNPGFSYLLENDGHGSFTIAADASQQWETPIVGRNGIFPEGEWAPGGFWAVAIDANNDGQMDLDFGHKGIWVDGEQVFRNLLMLNSDEATFDLLPGDAWTPPSWTVHPDVQHALVYDINNDGLNDQLLHQSRADFSSPGLQVLINKGDGTFRDETETRRPFQSPDPLGDFQLHDLEGDGHLDLFAMVNWNLVDIRINDGEGFFRRLGENWVSTSHNWVVLDVDNDGGTDFLSADHQGLKLHQMNLPYGQVLDGTQENDRLIGGAFNNTFRGLAGNDKLDGGLGNDWLEGGQDSDEMIDTKGHETYVFNAEDLAWQDSIWDNNGIDTLKFIDFDLDRVSSVEQAEGGHLQINFTDGGGVLVFSHFSNPEHQMEQLVAGGCNYSISNDPGFASGPIQGILSGCILFRDGFEKE